ncbi:DUF1214 domain-containing protein [Aldersonia sp. NBC_00410]|uniref:DUF1214 domain-containing protein n=1 Tax=Aldersonia sp. NBC_00410 TaxID=2975954 RepID=UPI00225AC0AD|nr:DUF1214 domain-containing protein [Aldersonia sp. NBC_00410]MCX5044747.1 DUF1214 domain-containing protein [Aldersonia sp. NBC_00410]
MRLTGIGSQYLVAFKDHEGGFFAGALAYALTLPPDIPAARFWSVTLCKGFFVILRLYSPLGSFFDKTWRPGEVGRIG